MESGQVTATIACPVCGEPTNPAGTKFGAFAGRDFSLRRCPSCWFAFVEDPWADFEQIYGPDYYQGKGADRLVDYLFELEEPHRTIRHYEWTGIVKILCSLFPVTRDTTWLDYGCGNGGLVEYCRRHVGCNIVGFEEGWIQGPALAHGRAVIGSESLGKMEGSFDVVTMIEVLEHISDPIDALRSIRKLLKPGGVLFLTTGNARPYRARLSQWRYVIPEIHVSFFEPETLNLALRRAGFAPETTGYAPGHTDVIRYKVLKNVGVRRRSPVYSIAPWPLIARLVDRRFGITAHPVGRAI